MKKLSIIGAALALAIPAATYAAADCCKDMACCKDKQAGESCCDPDKHAGHHMPATPAK